MASKTTIVLSKNTDSSYSPWRVNINGEDWSYEDTFTESSLEGLTKPPDYSGEGARRVGANYMVVQRSIRMSIPAAIWDAFVKEVVVALTPAVEPEPEKDWGYEHVVKS